MGNGEEDVSGGREETADLDSRPVVSQPSLSLAATVVTKTTTATIPTPNQGRRNDEMTLDELGPQRVPSPDIAAILSVTPRPALSRSGADTETRSKYDETLERVLEGNGSEDEEDAAVWDGGAAGDKRRGRRSRRVGGNNAQEGEGDSDSSLDLHTPLPYAYFLFNLFFPLLTFFCL